MKLKWFTFDPSDGYITQFPSKREAEDNFLKVQKLYKEVIFFLDEEKCLENYELICWGEIYDNAELTRQKEERP